MYIYNENIIYKFIIIIQGCWFMAFHGIFFETHIVKLFCICEKTSSIKICKDHFFQGDSPPTTSINWSLEDFQLFCFRTNLLSSNASSDNSPSPTPLFIYIIKEKLMILCTSLFVYIWLCMHVYIYVYVLHVLVSFNVCVCTQIIW